MTAIETLKEELRKVLVAQQECVTDDGVVKNGYKYRYCHLIETASQLKKSINWLEALYLE